MKEITINMKTYPSMAAACKELNLSWHLVSKEIRSRSAILSNTVVIDLEDYKSNEKRINREPLPQSWLDALEEDRIYTLEETSDKMFELGITKTRTTRSNIQQMEKEAIKKLKNILKDDEDVLLFLGLL